MPELTYELKQASNAIGTVIIAPAMGIRYRFYMPLAKYLVANGYNALLFEYHGMFHAEVTDENEDISIPAFGSRDINQAIQIALKEQLPVYLIGHSIAGQVLPLAKNSNQLEKVFLVGSQNVYHGHWTGKERLLCLALWYFIIPFFTTLTGKLPGWTYQGKYALHKRIGRDWAKFGKTKKGLAGYNKAYLNQYDAFQVPTSFTSMEQDHLLAPVKAVEALKKSFGAGQHEHMHLTRDEYELPSMGHFDFFKESHQKLWPLPLKWFNAEEYDESNQN